jgi:acyl-CoA synthetase (AMP-forming)/AMP-acid ligase II
MSAPSKTPSAPKPEPGWGPISRLRSGEARRSATVIGLPHAEYGEEVAAVLQVGRDSQAEGLAEEITLSLAHKLARFKIPTAITLTEADLPRTATGKVLKRDLRAQFFGEPVT